MKNIFSIFLMLSIFLLFPACNRQEKGIDISNIHFRISSPYGTHYITGKEIPFRATDANGNDITSAVTFLVDGQAIAGSSHIFRQAGHHTVGAVWDLGGTEKQADENLEAEVIDPRSRTRVLIDDFTGTWCVNCPRVIYHLEEAMQQVDGIVPVAIHNRGYNTDPFHFEGVEELATAYNISAYPTPLLNRKEVWDEQVASIREELARPAVLGIRIENRVMGNRLDISVDVRFDMDLPEDTLKIVVYALENGLHADQANATQYYGGQDPIPGFEHNHVLRHSFTSVLGDDIPAGEQRFDHVYRWTYSGEIPSEISDSAQMELVAFVVKGSEKPYVVNVNKTAIDETCDY